MQFNYDEYLTKVTELYHDLDGKSALYITTKVSNFINESLDLFDQLNIDQDKIQDRAFNACKSGNLNFANNIKVYLTEKFDLYQVHMVEHLWSKYGLPSTESDNSVTACIEHAIEDHDLNEKTAQALKEITSNDQNTFITYTIRQFEGPNGELLPAHGVIKPMLKVDAQQILLFFRDIVQNNKALFTKQQKNNQNTL